jgi:molecular chaperone GrpE
LEDFVGEYTEQIEKLTKENEHLKDQIVRKTAEMDNILKRSIKEKNDLIVYANMGLLTKFLPLMDDFAKAIDAGSKNQDYESLFTGIQMIYKKAEKTFEEAGVKKIEIEPGTKFNVELHEAIMQMPSENIEEGNILQVAQDGFMLRDRVLRHAKVIISSGKAE